MTKQERIMNITHTDLDGVACGLLLEEIYGKHTQVKHVNNGYVDSTVEDLITTGEINQYDKVYITDLAITSTELAERIDKDYGEKVQIIDHHLTAKWLNKYSWALVVEKQNNRKEAGISLLWKYLKANGLTDHYGKQAGTRIKRVNVGQFVETVRSYDTWEWYETNNYPAKQLNDLFFLKSISDFRERMVRNQLSPQLTKLEEGLLEGVQCKINKHLETKRKQLQEMEHTVGEQTYTYGVVFAEDYISELGNMLSEENPHLDVIVMIDLGRKRMSYRTIHNHVDCSKLAKDLGGGGHSKASGSPIDPTLMAKLL